MASPAGATSPRATAPWAYALVLLPPIIVGAAVSAALLVDYLRPAAVFCEEGGGCDAVKRSAWAHVGGIPTPALGLAAFLALGALALLRGPRARAAAALIASAAALIALYLIYMQVTMNAFCKLCLIADPAAVLACVGAWVRAARRWELPSGRRLAFIGAASLAAAVVAPVALGLSLKPPVPPAIAEEQAKSPAGLVTVVDFVDFECPYCRITHETMRPLFAEHRGEIRVVRKQVPLRMHPHARDAARAACCGDLLGRGEAMADALFAAPILELTPSGCERMAASLGLDPARFRACVADPATDERIERETSDFFDRSHGRGLPTLWIGDEKIEGARAPEAYTRAMLHAIEQKS